MLFIKTKEKGNIKEKKQIKLNENEYNFFNILSLHYFNIYLKINFSESYGDEKFLIYTTTPWLTIFP